MAALTMPKVVRSRKIRLPIDLQMFADTKLTVRQLATFAAAVGGRIVHHDGEPSLTRDILGISLELDADRITALLVESELLRR